MQYGEYFKRFNGNDECFDRQIDCRDISEECNARELMGYIPWAFKLENLTFRKETYNVYYDEQGTVFNKGKGLIIERA